MAEEALDCTKFVEDREDLLDVLGQTDGFCARPSKYSRSALMNSTLPWRSFGLAANPSGHRTPIRWRQHPGTVEQIGVRVDRERWIGEARDQNASTRPLPLRWPRVGGSVILVLQVGIADPRAESMFIFAMDHTVPLNSWPNRFA